MVVYPDITPIDNNIVIVGSYGVPRGVAYAFCIDLGELRQIGGLECLPADECEEDCIKFGFVFSEQISMVILNPKNVVKFVF